VTCPKMNLSYSWLPFSTAKPKANRPRLRGCTDAEMEFHGALLFADMPHAEGHIRPGGIGVPLRARRTRQKSRCRSPAMSNGRCRLHGGKSPGAPKGNQNAFKHGRYSVEAIAARREIAALLRTMRTLVERH
jgi:hypothetical protein